MRHRIAGKRLSRTTSHRRALRRNMAASLIEHGAIRTTEPKAKELRSFVEKLITLARKGTLHARRQVIAALQIRHVVGEDNYTDRWKHKTSRGKTIIDVLFDEVAPRYANRPGGYTRIIHLSDRRIGDAGRQVLLQLVEETAAKETAAATTGRRRRHAAKRHEAVAAVPAEAPQEAPQPEEQEPSEQVDAERAEGAAEDEQAKEDEQKEGKS